MDAGGEHRRPDDGGVRGGSGGGDQPDGAVSVYLFFDAGGGQRDGGRVAAHAAKPEDCERRVGVFLYVFAGAGFRGCAGGGDGGGGKFAGRGSGGGRDGGGGA